MEENLLAVVRIKPSGSTKAVWLKEDSTVVGGSDGKETYNLDKVFDGKTNNKSIFDESVIPLMDAVVQGYNVSVLGYGSSGSGKTHSLTGVPEGELGLVQEIFRNLMERFKKDSSNKYRIHMSCLEIYCEKLRDLLLERSPELQIMEKNGEPYIAGLTQMPISSLEDFDTHLRSATNRREVGSTTLNSVSSRSHYIIRLVIESTSAEATMEVKSRSSIVHIVDLAGSENASIAQTSGVRNMEGANINKSLLALTKCISLLSECDRRKMPNLHVPYRDSKLTRVLKPCLGGNSKTLMICCISPDQLYESQSTLKFSRLVKNVKARPVKNEVSENGDLAMYLKQINDLRQQLKESEEKRASDEDYNARCKKLDEMTKCIIEGEKSAPIVKKANRRHSWAPGALKAKPRRSLSPLKKKGRLDNIVESDDGDEEFNCDALGSNSSFGLKVAFSPAVSSTPRSSLWNDVLANKSTIRSRSSSTPPIDGNSRLEATSIDLSIEQTVARTTSEELQSRLVCENERLREEVASLAKRITESSQDNIHDGLVEQLRCEMLTDKTLINDLRSQLDTKETTIISINTEVNHLNSLISKEAERLREESAAYTMQLSIHRDDVSNLKTEVDDLRKIIEVKNQEIDLLTVQLSDERRKAEKYDADLSEQNRSLRSEILVGKSLIDDLRSQLIAKDSHIKSSHSEVSRLESILCKQAEELQEVKKTSDAVIAENCDLQNTIVAKDQEVEELTAQLHVEQPKAKKYDHGIAEQKDNLSNEISIGQTTDELKSELNSKDYLISSLNSEISRLNSALSKQSVQLQEEKSTAVTNAIELDANRADVADLQMQIAAKNQEIAHITAQLMDEQNCAEIFSEEIALMTFKLTSIEEENTQLQKDKVDLQKQIDAMLDESLTKVKESEKNPEAETLDTKQIDDLQRNVVELESVVTCQKANAEELQKQLLERDEALRSKSDGIAHLKTELTNERQKLVRSLETNRILETRYHQIQSEVRDLEETNSKLTVDKRQLTILLEEEKKQRAHVESSISKLSSELNAAQESAKQMGSVKEQCAITIDSQKKTIMRLEVDLQMAKDDLKQTKTSISEQSHAECNIKVVSLSSELDIAVLSTREKEAELKELMERISCSEKNICNLKQKIVEMSADISVKEDELGKAKDLIAEQNKREEMGLTYIRSKKAALEEANLEIKKLNQKLQEPKRK